MSGITRSMPSISSSGNMRPASTTTMSSPCSTASMFFPISPTPPSGMMRSAALVAKERHLIGGLLLHRLLRPRVGREHERERGEVTLERGAQRRLVERGGRVIHREQRHPVQLPRASVDARDRLTGKELPHRVAAERDDDTG